MAPNKSEWQTSFTGTFEHGVDDKRRVQIPSRWRPPEAGFEFTLIQRPKGLNNAVYLVALTPAQLDEAMAKVDRMEEAKEISADDASTLRRGTFGQALSVKLDSAGRICLPEALATSAGLTDQAVLVGTGKRFEIWSPDRLKAKLDHDKLSEERTLNIFGL